MQPHNRTPSPRGECRTIPLVRDDFGNCCISTETPFGVILTPVWTELAQPVTAWNGAASPAATVWTRATAPPPAFAPLSQPVTAWREALGPGEHYDANGIPCEDVETPWGVVEVPISWLYP